MDNVDGKQARRTGQSSGLGELFEYVYGHHHWVSVLKPKQPWHRLSELHPCKLV